MGFKELEEEEVGLLFTVCWAIWNARCRASMEGEMDSPYSIWSYAAKTFKECKDASVIPSRPTALVSAPLQTRWSAPEAGWMKLNVDAGRLGECGSGLGLVGRDNRGCVVGCVAVQVRGL